jgi:hypothetical protein
MTDLIKANVPNVGAIVPMLGRKQPICEQVVRYAMSRRMVSWVRYWWPLGALLAFFATAIYGGVLMLEDIARAAQ